MIMTTYSFEKFSKLGENFTHNSIAHLQYGMLLLVKDCCSSLKQ